jgi:hypothetical protein
VLGLACRRDDVASPRSSTVGTRQHGSVPPKCPSGWHSAPLTYPPARRSLRAAARAAVLGRRLAGGRRHPASEDTADVWFHRVQCDSNSSAIARFRWPAASNANTSCSRVLSGSTWPGTATASRRGVGRTGIPVPDETRRQTAHKLAGIRIYAGQLLQPPAQQQRLQRAANGAPSSTNTQM